ncbi:hypothetical protein Tco_0351795, partial [Tanacetum coccineum]
MTSQFEAWKEEVLCKNVSIIDEGPSVEEHTILFIGARDPESSAGGPSVKEQTILFMDVQDRDMNEFDCAFHIYCVIGCFARCVSFLLMDLDDVFLAEEQPLHAATSPTAESPGYIPESDPEEDPADYPADRDDDDKEEEEEEHPAPADFVPPVHRMTARISIWDEPSISLPPREE